MATKARPKGLRCPSCKELIEEVYILHTVCERWTVYEREDRALSAYRRYDTVGDTEHVEFDCGCSFSGEHIEKVRPILETLEAIEEQALLGCSGHRCTPTLMSAE